MIEGGRGPEDLGADAMIGVDRADAHIGIGERSMLMVSADGTVVKLG